MMWWPPYRRRVLAAADELMEYFGNEARTAASRLLLEAREKRDFKRVRFYRHVERYLEPFVTVLQEPYTAKSDPVADALKALAERGTLH